MRTRSRVPATGLHGIRRRWLLVLVVVAGFVLVVARASHEPVAMPSNQATPQEVVRAYGDAVHAGDCVTADALVVSSGRSWCGDVEINSMRITETTSEKRATESGDGPQITRVWVEMNVSGGDSSLPEGQML